MPIKNLIGRGIGFSPGSIAYIVTHGLEPSPAAPVTALAVTLEMKFSGDAGAWTAVTADLRLNPNPVFTYGIGGNSPTDRMASTGSFSFGMDNSEGNSAGLVGYYSPGHANARSGFELGIKVRLSLARAGTTYYKFVGRIVAINPVPGASGPRITLCSAVDWMDEAARYKLTGIATQTIQRSDELIDTIETAMVKGAEATSYDAAQLEYLYALDDVRDEDTTALSALNRCVMSDLGILVLRGDTTQGGTLKYYDRRTRSNPGAALATINVQQAMTVVRKRENIRNRVNAIVHPRRVDADATTVLYLLDQSNPPALAAGEEITIIGQYTDPTLRASRVGGVDMVTPVADTDYAAGSGPGDTSLTADLGVVASFTSNSVIWTLTNNGSSTIYVTLLQARGRGLYGYQPFAVRATDSTSQDSFGEAVLTLDMPYESREHVAKSIADYYLSKYKDAANEIDSLTLRIADGSSLVTHALAREPGDLIEVTETVTAQSGTDYFIQSVTIVLVAGSPAVIFDVTWLLARRLDTASYWVLGTSDDLGTDTILGI